MRYVLALAVMLLASTAFAAPPSVSVSLNPASGVAPYPSTLTWSATGASSCTASDGWTGSKALTGTQSVTVNAATKYTLTCIASDGQTTTVWTPPTLNTDSTPYTNGAGYSVYRGTTATNLARIKSLGPAVLSYQDTGLASGNYYYAVTSVNANSAESAMGKATPYPVAVTGSSSAASATADVQSIPNAPGGVITTTVSVSVNVTTAN